MPRYALSLMRALNEFRRKGGVVRTTIVMVDSSEVLKGKAALVTGGSHGIGLAIAKKFIASGARVVITGRKESDLRAAVEAAGTDRLSWMVWDVADTQGVEMKLSEAEELVGASFDILVNNAGVLMLDPFLEVTEANWDKTYAINSKGLFFLTQALCRRWVTQRQTVRKVIMVSSTSGFLPGAYPYRMSKWDVVGLTQGLAVKLADKGICVNGIAPGRTAGRMLGNGRSNIADSQIPMGRTAMPEELAELALFLAGGASNYITGQTIICDGGHSLANET